MFLYDKLQDRFISKLEAMIERSLNENISRLEKDIKDIKDIGKDNRKTLEQNILSLQKDIERRLQTRCQKSDEDLEAVKAETLTAVSKLLPRKGLQHLDYHLTTHCNLNCKGCSVFSPIAKEWFAAPEEFKKEIEALRKALDGASPVNIHLLGGEPLLHPQIESFAFIARDVFPEARIDFTTNGLLVRQMPETFWETLRQTQVAIKYTRYPIGLDYDDLIRYIQDKGVEVFSAGGEIAFFRRIPMNPKGTFNMFHSYIQCPYTDCAQLRNGKLFRCPASAFHGILNENLESSGSVYKGRFKLSRRDYVDLYNENITRETVYDFLSNAIPFCSYCDTARMNPRVPWSQSEKNLTEWVDF